MGFGLVLLPLQQPWECHCGTPLHVWMVYCPNVDVHDGPNALLLVAVGVAHGSGSLGGSWTGAPPLLPVPMCVPGGTLPWIKSTKGTNF